MYEALFNRLKGHFEAFGVYKPYIWDTGEVISLFEQLFAANPDKRYEIERNLYASLDDIAVEYMLMVDGEFSVMNCDDF